jgi:PleD family two-component response regulator
MPVPNPDSAVARQAKLLLVDDTAAQRLALRAILADLDVAQVEAASERARGGR